MKHELEPVGRTIIIAGGTEGVGLIGRKELTDEQLLQNDLTFQRCGKLLGWEWADNIAEMMDRKLAEQAKQLRIDFETQDEREKRTRAKVAEYAQVRGLAAHTVLIRVCVAEFFPIEKRRMKLDFSHHIEVWSAGLEIDEACKWLERAERGKGEERWTVAELRAELKKASNGANEEPSLEDDVPRDVSRFERWAAMSWSKLKGIEPLDAIRLLSELAHASRVIDHLRQVAGATSKDSRVLPEFSERR